MSSRWFLGAVIIAGIAAVIGALLWRLHVVEGERNRARAEVATLMERAATMTSERDAALERIRDNNRAIAAMRERADAEAREADRALAELDRRNREWRRRLEMMRPGVDGMNAFVAEVLR